MLDNTLDLSSFETQSTEQQGYQPNPSLRAGSIRFLLEEIDKLDEPAPKDKPKKRRNKSDFQVTTCSTKSSLSSPTKKQSIISGRTSIKTTASNQSEEEQIETVHKTQGNYPSNYPLIEGAEGFTSNRTLPRINMLPIISQSRPEFRAIPSPFLNCSPRPTKLADYLSSPEPTCDDISQRSPLNTLPNIRITAVSSARTPKQFIFPQSSARESTGLSGTLLKSIQSPLTSPLFKQGSNRLVPIKKNTSEVLLSQRQNFAISGDLTLRKVFGNKSARNQPLDTEETEPRGMQIQKNLQWQTSRPSTFQKEQ